METKTESELIVTGKDVLVRQRIAYRSEGTGSHILQFQYPILIKGAKAKDKFGDLQVERLDSNSIQVTVNRNIPSGKAHGLEITILIKPDYTFIGGIKIFSWGSLDLFRLTTYSVPFQVIGFLNSQKKDNRYIYTNNIAKNITSHIAKYRSTRVEIGKELKIRLKISYNITIPNGTTLSKFTSFGPLTTKRQSANLITQGITIEYDENQNPYYAVTTPQTDSFQLNLVWDVKVQRPPMIDSQLGSAKALKIALKDSSKLRELVKGNKETWHIQDSRIQTIAQKANSYPSIFEMHKFLFEFTNRRIRYQANGIRYSPIEALEQRIGDCSEYADLLVTLHRASGIPSKVVEGIILNTDTNRTGEGHAWVEFLSTKGWISCDPTWGLHLGISAQHIAFNTQKNYSQTHMFEMTYHGNNPPQVQHQITWDPLID